MRSAMHDLGLTPDLVLVSSARRTLQTLEALAPWDDVPLVEPMDALYLASAHAILDVLHNVTETVRSVLVIGHNPGLHELAMVLVGAHGHIHPQPSEAAMLQRLAEGYPTGALTEFSVAGPWGTLGEGSGKLLRFLAPSDLPDVA
jgi:phosphohistidine phosphatase